MARLATEQGRALTTIADKKAVRDAVADIVAAIRQSADQVKEDASLAASAATEARTIASNTASQLIVSTDALRVDNAALRQTVADKAIEVAAAVAEWSKYVPVLSHALITVHPSNLVLFNSSSSSPLPLFANFFPRLLLFPASLQDINQSP